MLVNYHLRLDLPSLPVDYVEWRYVPCYVTIFPVFGTLISTFHRCFITDLSSRERWSTGFLLWIWLTRFSHPHNLKCETVRITTFLEITRSTVGDVLRWFLAEWFTHLQTGYLLTSLLATHSTIPIPTEAPGRFQHTSPISYHREAATALALNCDRSLSYKSYSQGLKYRVSPTKPHFSYLVFSSMNAYPVSVFFFLKIPRIYPLITYQEGTRVWYFSTNGEVKYAVVKSSALLADVCSHNLLIPNRIDEFFWFSGNPNTCPRSRRKYGYFPVCIFSLILAFLGSNFFFLN